MAVARLQFQYNKNFTKSPLAIWHAGDFVFFGKNATIFIVKYNICQKIYMILGDNGKFVRLKIALSAIMKLDY